MQSAALIVILVFGVLFSVLYTSTYLSIPRHEHDAIPTEPRISQLQAIQIVEQNLKAEVSDLESARLIFYLYNYSEANTSHNWDFAVVKQNPEFLQLPLVFIHANGTIYTVNSTSRSYEKACEKASVECPFGRRGGSYVFRDRLLYRTEAYWNPPAVISPSVSVDFGYHVVDAETGEIVWNSIDYERNRRPDPPNVDYQGQRTIKMRLEEKLNPPETIQIWIANGSFLEAQQYNFQPEHARGMISIDKFMWINNDTVPHTVRSDANYTSPYTGAFASNLIMPHGTYVYTFTDVGKYGYHCDIHPWMRGDIEMLESFA